MNVTEFHTITPLGIPKRPMGLRAHRWLLGSALSLFVALTGLGTRLDGRPKRLEPNIREACRLALTGAYINAYDDKERERHFIRALKEQLEQVDVALKKAVAASKLAKEKNEAHSYEVALAQKVDETYSIQKGYEDQKALLLSQLTAAQTAHDHAVAKEKSLRKSLEPIFEFSRFDDRPDGGYPVETRYRSPCPPYRALCILPQKDVDILAKVQIDGELPEPCKRYLTLGRTPSD